MAWMPRSSLFSALALTIILTTVPSYADSGHQGREVNWQGEVSLALGLVLLGTAVEQLTPYENVDNNRELPTQTLDQSVRNIIHGAASERNMTASEHNAHWASNFTIASLYAASAGMVWREDNPGKGMTFLHGAALNALVTQSLKVNIRRHRPKKYYHPDLETKRDRIASFPSGHTSHAMQAATAFYLLFPELPTWTHALGFSFGVGTGILRIAADKHWFSDTVAGGLIGVASAYTAFTIFEQQEMDATTQRGPRLHLQAHLPAPLVLTWKF